MTVSELQEALGCTEEEAAMKFVAMYTGERPVCPAANKMNALHAECLALFKGTATVDTEISMANNFDITRDNRSVRVVFDHGEPAVLKLDDYDLRFLEDDQPLAPQVDAILKDDELWE